MLHPMRGEVVGARVQVVELPGHCYACGAGCETRMFTTAIPHFKEVVIMSNSCDACGYRDSEVKPGGGFSDRGRKITLQATSDLHLGRTVPVSIVLCTVN